MMKKHRVHQHRKMKIVEVKSTDLFNSNKNTTLVNTIHATRCIHSNEMATPKASSFNVECETMVTCMIMMNTCFQVSCSNEQ